MAYDIMHPHARREIELIKSCLKRNCNSIYVLLNLKMGEFHIGELESIINFFLKRGLVMKKLFYLFIAIFIMSLFTVQANAQDIKLRGYLHNWITFSQQRDALTNHPGVEAGDWGFRVRRARIGFKVDINDFLAVNALFDFADPSKTLLDFAGIIQPYPELVFTVGQFIAPGQMYETAILGSTRIPFYERSDISIKLANNMGLDSYRDVGIMIGGTIASAANLKYAAYMGNGYGRLLFQGDKAGNILNRKFGQGFLAFRADVEPIKGLIVGAHYSTNKQDSVVTELTSPKPLSKDKSSFSFNIVEEGLGLPEISASFEYGAGTMKEVTPKIDYDGLNFTVGYKITPLLQVLFRYDTYNEKKDITTTPNETKAKNTNFGVNYYFFKEKLEVMRIGLDYVIRKEEPIESDNNLLVLWMQVRF
jgi:hypothetical protein